MPDDAPRTLARLALAGVVMGCLASAEAMAQAEVPANPPPAGTPQAPAERVEPPAGGGQNLSEELQRSRGVLTPPAGVDPTLVKPPPDNGAAVTPVIPPPAPPATQPQ